MITVRQPEIKVAPEAFAETVARHTARMQALWWSSGTAMPDLGRAYTPAQQRANERRLNHLRERLTAQWKRLPPGAVDEANTLRERSLDEAFLFLREVFDFPAEPLAVLVGVAPRLVLPARIRRFLSSRLSSHHPVRWWRRSNMFFERPSLIWHLEIIRFSQWRQIMLE